MQFDSCHSIAKSRDTGTSNKIREAAFGVFSSTSTALVPKRKVYLWMSLIKTHLYSHVVSIYLSK